MKENEKMAVEVLVSPCRLGIMNKLAKNRGGMTAEEIAKIINNGISSKRHLYKLVEAGVVEDQDGKYVLTDYGKRVYSTMRNIAQEAEAIEMPA